MSTVRPLVTLALIFALYAHTGTSLGWELALAILADLLLQLFTQTSLTLAGWARRLQASIARHLASTLVRLRR